MKMITYKNDGKGNWWKEEKDIPTFGKEAMRHRYMSLLAMKQYYLGRLETWYDNHFN
jgi:hypothetical protein